MIFTILLMMTEPITTMIVAMTSAIWPASSLNRGSMYVGVDQEEDDEDEDGQEREDPARQPTLRRERSDEAEDLLAGADVLDHPVEHLGHVAARVALKQSDDRDLLHVLAVHAPGGHLERLVERDAELLVGHDPPELVLRRLRRLVDDDGHRAGERVSRAERGCEHVEVVGKLVGEGIAGLPRAARDHPADDERDCDAEERPEGREYARRRTSATTSVRNAVMKAMLWGVRLISASSRSTSIRAVQSQSLNRSRALPP